MQTTLKIEDVPMMAMGSMAPGPAKVRLKMNDAL